MWLIYAIIAAADFKTFWTLSDMKENKQSVKKTRNSAHKLRTNEARETALFLYIRLIRSYFAYKGLFHNEGLISHIESKRRLMDDFSRYSERIRFFLWLATRSPLITADRAACFADTNAKLLLTLHSFLACIKSLCALRE